VSIAYCSADSANTGNHPTAGFRVNRALADSQGFVMGHALRAWLHLLGTEPAGVPVAREALDTARGLTRASRGLCDEVVEMTRNVG
jgi:hypothetical protein